MIYFETVKNPADLICNTENAIEHVLHHWCYNVYHNERPIAVFYITVMCGIGGVLHFDCETKVDPVVTLAAMKRGLKLAKKSLPLVFASARVHNDALIHLFERLGFEKIRHFEADGEHFVLMILRQ